MKQLYFRCARVANSVVGGLAKIKLIQSFMVVLVTYKNEEEPFNKECTRTVSTLFINFFRCSRAGSSKVRDGILLKFKLIQAFMVGPVT